VFTDAKKAEFIGALTVSGFIATACAYIGISESGVRSAANRDPAFRAAIEKALATRKMLSIRRITNAQAWQAHAWWLERTDPQTFGRKVALEHSGPEGGPIQQQTTVTRQDFEGLSVSELLDLRDEARRRLAAKAGA